MKRVNNLFKQVYTFENLLSAYKKARKGTKKNADVNQFSFQLEKRLLELSLSIQSGTYQPSRYRYFEIYDPKKRTIAVAPFCDRVVHHAIINMLEPIYEKRFYDHSYATRKNKGAHKATAQLRNYLKNNTWYFKTDIEKYFDSINHDILLSIIAHKIKDKPLLELIEKVIRNNSVAKGLPIGNLTSQFFANVYLNEFDHFVKHELKVKYYIRYMDDFIILDNCKLKLQNIRREVKGYLENKLLLYLQENVTCINRVSSGINFLGLRIFPNTLRIKNKNLKRVVRKMEARIWLWKNGYMAENIFIDSMNSYWAFLSYHGMYNLRRSIIDKSLKRCQTFIITI